MLIFCLLAVNEIDYVDAVIASVKPYCDKIIVVECCARRPFDYLYSEGFVTKDGLSTDGTTEYFVNRVKEKNDILYLPIGTLDGTVEACAFRECHRHIKNGDYVWVGTGNEVYFSPKCEKICSFVGRSVPYINVGQIVMWKDLRHRIVGGSWGHPVIRVYKYDSGEYVFNQWSTDCPPCKFDKSYSTSKFRVEDGCMKLAFARDERRVFHKIALQDIEYNDRLNNLKGYSSIEDYIHRTHHFYNDVHAPGIGIEHYYGEYPAVITAEIYPHSQIYNAMQSDGWEEV